MKRRREKERREDRKKKRIRREEEKFKKKRKAKVWICMKLFVWNLGKIAYGFVWILV